MPTIDQRVKSLGLALPVPLQLPPGVVLPFPWVRVFCMVNSAPGFHRQPAVINGFTDLIIEVFGVEKGVHARSAVGLAELPFNIPVEIEGEVEVLPR
jgi:hypothetical protein